MGPKKDKHKQSNKDNEDKNTSFEGEINGTIGDSKIISILERLLEQQERNFKLFETTIINTLKDSFNVQIASVSNELFSLNSKFDKLEKENRDLKVKADERDDRIAYLESELSKANNETDELESYVRRQCLVINNLKPQQGKTDLELFMELCSTNFADLNITSETISKLHRLPRNPHNQTDNDKPLALVVKFVKDMVRDSLFKNKKNLKGKGVTITELLTSKRSQLLSKCIEKIPYEPMPRAIWTDNGRILVKLGNNRPFLIKTNNDLDKLLREIPQYIANFGNSAPA